jgi:hypothetical protein
VPTILILLPFFLMLVSLQMTAFLPLLLFVGVPAADALPAVTCLFSLRLLQASLPTGCWNAGVFAWRPYSFSVPYFPFLLFGLSLLHVPGVPAVSQKELFLFAYRRKHTFAY